MGSERFPAGQDILSGYGLTCAYGTLSSLWRGESEMARANEIKDHANP